MCDSSSMVQARDEHVVARSESSDVSGSVACSVQPVVVVQVVVPSLALNCLDHHFASGVETLRATYTTQHLGADNIKVRITGTHYGGDVVYEAQNLAANDAAHPLGWNGTVNTGALAGGFVTPLHSPYTLTITAETAQLTQSVRFHVLYREITLALGTYTETGVAPVQLNEPEKWVQYQLNVLGYNAGPVNGTIADDTITQRAMMRYAHEHVGLDWLRPYVDPDTFRQNGTFLTALTNGDNPRTLIQNNALPAAGNTARVYIDHNYFYNTLLEFGTDDGHNLLDVKMLDRPELPIEATLTLMSQTDADGTGAGVASPQAIGTPKVEWKVFHMPEDCDANHADSSLARPSRTRAYMKAAFDATRDGDGSKNCPVAFGGARAGTGTRNQSYFYIGNQLAPYASSKAGDRVFSTVYQGATAGKRGKAGILFRGSWIAGDRFELKAYVSFHGLPNKIELEVDHLDVFGMFNDHLDVRTGTLETWRRHRVAAVINWPAPNPLRAVTWPDVVAEFEPAYCELDTANIVTITGANYVANYLTGSPEMGIFGPMCNTTFGTAVTFGATALFPHTRPAQKTFETAREYKTRLLSLFKANIDTVSQYLADIVSATLFRQHPPGAVIIHGNWVEDVTVKHKSLGGLGRFGDDETWSPRVFCIGLAGGVAVIDNHMYPDFDDRFVIAHEMSHSRYLRHHEAGYPSNGTISDVPIDHDLSDNNCTMSYPFKIPSRDGLTWNPGGANRPGFCGKCILKLRGWKVATGALPAQS